MSRALDSYQIIHRITAALLGVYAFTWGFSALGIAGLVTVGVSFHEAEHATMLLAFLVFLVMFLWAFAANSLIRIWLTLAGGGAAMTASAWALQQAILS